MYNSELDKRAKQNARHASKLTKKKVAEWLVTQTENHSKLLRATTSALTSA